MFSTAVVKSPVKKSVAKTAEVPKTMAKILFNPEEVPETFKDREGAHHTKDDFRLFDTLPDAGQEPPCDKQELLPEPVDRSKEIYMSQLHDTIIRLGEECENETTDKKVYICAVVVTKILLILYGGPEKTNDRVFSNMAELPRDLFRLHAKCLGNNCHKETEGDVIISLHLFHLSDRLGFQKNCSKVLVRQIGRWIDRQGGRPEILKEGFVSMCMWILDGNK
jgi:hypothetical protein